MGEGVSLSQWLGKDSWRRGYLSTDLKVERNEPWECLGSRHPRQKQQSDSQCKVGAPGLPSLPGLEAP